MNVYERFTAAVGSVALNVMLALVLAQGARAAVPATDESLQGPQSHVVYAADKHPAHVLRCAPGLRAREILAVLLALVV